MGKNQRKDEIKIQPKTSIREKIVCFMERRKHYTNEVSNKSMKIKQIYPSHSNEIERTLK